MNNSSQNKAKISSTEYQFLQSWIIEFFCIS